MPISLVGSNVGVTAAAANITINLPAGVLQNDVAYAAVATGATTDIDVTETGGTWTELADLYGNDTTDVNMAVYRKVMGVTPDTSVTMDASAGTNIHVGIVVVLRGVDTTTPEDATTTTLTAIDTGTPNNPSITTVTAGAWVLAFAASSEGDATVNAPLHYGDLRSQIGTNIAIVFSRRLCAATGAEDPPAYSGIVGTTADSIAAVTIAARPASSGGPYEPVRTMHSGRMRRAA
jgi:hypothetical protein